MKVEITKSGAKSFRFEAPLPQVGGGYEDTMMTPCGSRGCENTFEQTFPEPEETPRAYCPDCISASDPAFFADYR